MHACDGGSVTEPECQIWRAPAGERYTFTIAEGANGAGGRISVNYDGFIDDVSVGDTLLVDGGIQSLKIVSVDGPDVLTEVVDGGVMKSRCAQRWASLIRPTGCSLVPVICRTTVQGAA
jgi:hypothetical protein